MAVLGTSVVARLLVAQGHVLAAVFESPLSPSLAELCHDKCWETFLRALAAQPKNPAAATLAALSHGAAPTAGCLGPRPPSLEGIRPSRLFEYGTGAVRPLNDTEAARADERLSGTLLHIDLVARTVTVATMGAHGAAVGLGCVGAGPPGQSAPERVVALTTDPTLAPPPSAACIILRIGPAPATATPAAAMPLPLPLNAPRRRWELLRAYCRFLAARRRHILATWHAAAARIVALSQPAATPMRVLSFGARAMLGSASSAGGRLRSDENETACPNRTASFSSRAPVIMEFVEELASPTPSVRQMAGDGGGGGGGGGARGAAVSGAGPNAALSSAGTAMAAAAEATVDESLSEVDAGLAPPFGVDGLVMAPINSSEDEEDGAHGGAGASTGHRPYPAAPAAPGRPPLFGRVTAPGEGLVPRGKVGARAAAGAATTAAARLGPTLVSSRSSPDLNKPSEELEEQLKAISRLSAGDVDLGDLDLDAVSGVDASAAAEAAAASAAAAAEAEAIAFVRGGAGYGPGPGASATGYGRASNGGAGGAGSGILVSASSAGAPGADSGAIDWSLVMASMSSGGVTNSAGHTPMPSTTGYPQSGHAHSVPTGFGAGDAGSAAAAAAAAAGSGGDVLHPPQGLRPLNAGAGRPQAGPLGAVLHQHVGAAARPLSPHAPGIGMVSYPYRPARPGLGRGRGAESGFGEPDLLLGDEGARVASASEGAGADDESPDAPDYEPLSEDLPALRIESTAELAALMAEIIISDDGEVVHTGGSGGGAAPSQYRGSGGGGGGFRAGLRGIRSGRSFSRPGSRAWQPRLAIVREDAREAHCSNSCSDALLSDGLRFSVISEERTSQGSGSGGRTGSARDSNGSGSGSGGSSGNTSGSGNAYEQGSNTRLPTIGQIPSGVLQGSVGLFSAAAASGGGATGMAALYGSGGSGYSSAGGGGGQPASPSEAAAAPALAVSMRTLPHRGLADPVVASAANQPVLVIGGADGDFDSAPTPVPLHDVAAVMGAVRASAGGGGGGAVDSSTGSGPETSFRIGGLPTLQSGTVAPVRGSSRLHSGDGEGEGASDITLNAGRASGSSGGAGGTTGTTSAISPFLTMLPINETVNADGAAAAAAAAAANRAAASGTIMLPTPPSPLSPLLVPRGGGAGLFGDLILRAPASNASLPLAPQEVTLSGGADPDAPLAPAASPPVAAAAGSAAANALASYDEGGVNSHTGRTLPSEASCSMYNSTSAWTATTGQTNTMGMDPWVISGRRFAGHSAFGGAHCSSSSAVGVGGGAGLADASGLIRVGAVYGSVSGLLVTADSAAPGSNTQLLMQVAYGGGGPPLNSALLISSQAEISPPQPGATDGSGHDERPAGGGGGAEAAISPAAASGQASRLGPAPQRGPQLTSTGEPRVGGQGLHTALARPFAGAASGATGGPRRQMSISASGPPPPPGSGRNPSARSLVHQTSAAAAPPPPPSLLLDDGSGAAATGSIAGSVGGAYSGLIQHAPADSASTILPVAEAAISLEAARRRAAVLPAAAHRALAADDDDEDADDGAAGAGSAAAVAEGVERLVDSEPSDQEAYDGLPHVLGPHGCTWRVPSGTAGVSASTNAAHLRQLLLMRMSSSSRSRQGRGAGSDVADGGGGDVTGVSDLLGSPAVRTQSGMRLLDTHAGLDMDDA
ncbi:hypothetical protein GPECTOR_31g356 [Gonium pectorale]|uniref:Uncharacterized protein n=1 Tax=Gonium pectorale TaxID=33097 RepID=A0A150GDZ3_GONPE|nr:hypothetical protein GPECTOR_31g356 [Gonium pectorale]|eukprot:KXZ47993.1 hypothetical protein GPECTOR_31g356 [Gonium pectorale]